MFGGSVRRAVARAVARRPPGTVRRKSGKAEMYPDRSVGGSRPNYQSPNGAAMEAGEDGMMEYASGAAVLITCAVFLYMPFMKSAETLDQWARKEAEARLTLKADGEDVEYGVWYSDAGKTEWAAAGEEEE